MKTLVIVHQGEFDDSFRIVDGEIARGVLTERAREKIREMAQSLRLYLTDELKGNNVVVLAAMSDAAEASAEILCA